MLKGKESYVQVSHYTVIVCTFVALCLDDNYIATYNNFILFLISATLAPEVEQWCSLNLDNVCSVSIGTRNTANQIVKQSLVYTGTEKGKLLAFRQLLQDGDLTPPVIVFVQTKDRAKELYKELESEKNQLHIDILHAERSQLQRLQTLQQFRAGYVWVLICTELVGRGIDFKVCFLIHFSFFFHFMVLC